MIPRPDLSKLPPPTPEFMAAMVVYREAIADFGKFSREAGIALGMALELAPRELSEWIAADARACGLLPEPSAFKPSGEPVYTAQALATFYGVDEQDVLAVTGSGESVAVGHGPH